MPVARPDAPTLPADAPHVFAVWTYGSREQAAAVVTEVAGTHADPEAQVAQLARAAIARRTGNHERDRLRHLDDVLRSDATIPVTLAHPLVRKDVRRLQVLQWELKRTCLMAVVAALPPMPRVVFVLRTIFGLPPERVAAICDATEAAVATAWARASHHLEDYLSARCQHIFPPNFCRCANRLGVALEQGFVGYPEHEHELPDAPVADTRPRSVVALYASLPPVRPPRAPGLR
jgi:DNA-directed RNA polymerase specialized sigma24 family protein